MQQEKQCCFHHHNWIIWKCYLSSWSDGVLLGWKSYSSDWHLPVTLLRISCTLYWNGRKLSISEVEFVPTMRSRSPSTRTCQSAGLSSRSPATIIWIPCDFRFSTSACKVLHKGTRFKNTHRPVNPPALKIQCGIWLTYFNVWARYFVLNSLGHQIYCLQIEKCAVYTKLKL